MNEITTRILKFLLLVFAVVLASSIFYHLFFTNYETENATYYEVSDVSSFQGVYVRDESVESYSGTGAVRYCVDDGAKLGVGSVIAEVYSDAVQIDLRSRIAEKEDEIAMLRKIENPGTSENAQPANLASLINEQFKSMIRLRERQDYSAMSNSKQDMTVLMSTYEKVTGSGVDFNDRIVALEDEVSRLTAQLSAPEKTIPAPESAYFVSFVDGYEDILTPDKMYTLTPEQLSGISDDGTLTATNAGEQVIGKLIRDYAWYIVGVFDNRKMHLSEGDRTKIRLESVPQELTVEVVSLYATGEIDKTQAVFRCDELTHDTVQHRTERVEIVRDTVEGIRVPRSAIRFKTLTEEQTDEDGNVTTTTNDYKGVYVLVGETPEFRKIDVIYEDENYYLSSLDAGGGYIALYDDIIVKGVMADGE